MRAALEEISKQEVGGHAGLQMLITACVASNWATLWMMFLTIGDMVALEEAATLAFGVNIAVFTAYLSSDTSQQLQRLFSQFTNSSTEAVSDNR